MRTLDPCWNRIGAWGGGTCPELARVVHCRNCPTYSQAAAELLNRDIPDDYLESAMRHFTDEVENVTRGAKSVVIFRVESEWLALDTAVLKEISDLRAIHSLPHQRNPAVIGIANVRGELLVCISLTVLLGAHKAARAEQEDRLARARLLVASRNGERLVFTVDEVHGIHRVDPSQLGEAPSTIARAAATYTRAMLRWRDKSVGVLDEEQLFDSLKRTLQ